MRLQPQPFRVLQFLASQPGKLITRDDLKHAIWNGSVFVDFEQGLNFCIRCIRAALNDDPNSPKFLETVPRRGYRFIAEVETVLPSEPANDSKLAASIYPEALELPPKKANRLHAFPWMFGIALLGLLSLSALLIRWRPPRTERFPIERRLTANPEESPVLGAAISPDGKFLAYGDTTGLYVKQVDGGDTRLIDLPGTTRAVPESWFPNSTDLLVSPNPPAGGKNKLWKISILGGNPQTLVDDGFGGAVSPDGRHIAFLRGGPDHGVGHEVWMMNLSDGSLRRLAGMATHGVGTSETAQNKDATDWFASVVWSSKGDQVAYTKFSLSLKQATIAIKVQSAAEPDAVHDLVSNLNIQPSICWLPDNRILYSERDEAGLAEPGLWSILVDPATGLAKGEPKRLPFSGKFERISATADAHSLMLLRAEASDQIFVSELRRPNQWTPLRRISLDQRTNTLWAWTPDGKSVLFTSDRNGRSQLFKQSIDQPTPELLVASPHTIRIARILPDGSGVIFSEMASPFPAGPIALMEIPFAGGQPHKILEEPGINNFQCARLPSRMCVYEETKDGEDSLFSYDTASGSIRKLTKLTDEPYGADWDFSPDGKRVAAMVSQNHIRFFDIATGQDEDVKVSNWKQLHTVDWSADSRSVLTVAIAPEGKSAVLQVDLKGEAHALFTAPKNMPLDWVIPSPDGKYMAAMGQSGQRNVWLAKDF